MKRARQRRLNGRTDLPKGPGYEVGYGKPPVATRFPKGVSGNPKGRPQGARTRVEVPPAYEQRFRTILMEEAYREVTVNAIDGTRSVPMIRATIRALAVNAAKGSHKAQQYFASLVNTVEDEAIQKQGAIIEAVMKYKTAWDAEFRRCKSLGLSQPEPFPHPNHLKIDIKTGAVSYEGPATPEDREHWYRWEAQCQLFERELALLKAQRCSKRGNDRALDAEIEKTETVIRIIRLQLRNGSILPEFRALEHLMES